MSHGKYNGRYDVRTIKQAAVGRWADIIPATTGLSADVLDGKGHACPMCGDGTDRFSAFGNFKETGGVLCRKCHNGDTNPKSGDGIAAVQWLTGSTFVDALRLIAEYVGVSPKDLVNDNRNILADLCKQKRMPVDSAKAYGAEIATRWNQRVVQFPVYGANGKPNSYSDVSPYAKGKLNKGVLPKGGTSGLHLPGRLPKPDETWLMVEGVKDAAVLHDLGYLAAGLTGCNMKSELARLFTGCAVILVPDLDRASLRGFSKTGTVLEAASDSVLVATLPGEVKSSNGDDVRDIIAREGAETVRKTIDQAKPFVADELLGGRPSVYITVDDDTEQEVANKVIRILASCGFATDDTENRLYQSGGKLISVAESDIGPRIVSVDEVGIRERITAAMDLVQRSVSPEGEENEKLCRPPAWLCKAIHGRPNYLHVRRLDGIVTAPTIRADGSILQTPGYDNESRLLFIPDGDYPAVPANPTQADAKRAAGELLDIVSDFPFDGDVAKSVWLALVLTLIGRAAIVGNVPLFGFSANIRGSGKSKLCDLAGLIAFGRTLARKTLPGDDDEMRKVITAIALEAKPAVLLDNAAGMIGNASLDAVLTADLWNDRILGKSKTTGDLPWRTVLMATGNNLAFKADTARRVILCQLDCRHETPEDRNDFKHADIEAYTAKHRHRLAVAALTILRAFVDAGRPYEGKRLGSFESWSELICAAVVFVGLPNPLETVSVVREQDNTGNIVRLLLDGIAAVGGVDGLTSKEILTGIQNESNTDEDWETLRAAFAEITDNPTIRKIGNILKRFQGRVCRGRRIIAKSGRSNIKRWAVENLDSITEQPDLDNFGNCDQCSEPLTASPTGDGFLNRHCSQCEKDFRCIPATTAIDPKLMQSEFI